MKLLWLRLLLPCCFLAVYKIQHAKVQQCISITSAEHICIHARVSSKITSKLACSSLHRLFLTRQELRRYALPRRCALQHTRVNDTKNTTKIVFFFSPLIYTHLFRTISRRDFIHVRNWFTYHFQASKREVYVLIAQ